MRISSAKQNSYFSVQNPSLKEILDIGYSRAKRELGFTLSELLVSIFIMVTLLSLVTINLSFAHRRTSLTNTVSTIVADVKEQQIKAMAGDTEGRATADNYGVYFQENSYVLFHGASYTPGDTTNKTVSLESSQKFLTPNHTLLFTRVSGDVSAYNFASASVVLRDKPSGNTKTIQYNRHGVVTGID